MLLLLIAFVSFIVTIITYIIGARYCQYTGASEFEYINEQEVKAFEDAKPEFDRIWHENNPRLPWRDNKLFRVNKHYGQRKLFLTEVEFLTMHGERAYVVLYIGSGPGNHIVFLLSLFPKHVFVLYDLVKHVPWLYTHPRVNVREEYFTDETARLFDSEEKIKLLAINSFPQYKDKISATPEKYNKILFITDIRDLGTGKSSDKGILVDIDMAAQLKWAQDMNPEASIFKFRENPNRESFDYLEGTIYIQPWMRPGASEGRLITLKNALVKPFNVRAYTESMYYHNLIVRQAWFDYDKRIRVIGADHCYDCKSEFYILENYIRTMLPNLGDNEVFDAVSEISNRLNRDLNQWLNVGPHGMFIDEKNTIHRMIKMYEWLVKSHKAN